MIKLNENEKVIRHYTYGAKDHQKRWWYPFRNCNSMEKISLIVDLYEVLNSESIYRDGQSTDGDIESKLWRDINDYIKINIPDYRREEDYDCNITEYETVYGKNKFRFLLTKGNDILIDMHLDNCPTENYIKDRLKDVGVKISLIKRSDLLVNEKITK